MLDKQEKKSEDQSVYGINQIEAAAGTAAHAAYVLGRKLAQKQKEIKRKEGKGGSRGGATKRKGTQERKR